MSLENSQYTFASLQEASTSAFRKEVDRITKETDHVDDDDDDTKAPSSAKRSRTTQPQDKDVSGTIVELTLEDFLCHRHMHIQFNSDINFVVGQNGSGKSAILTALVVALGGNASTTGRGCALKDFIKHGSPSAKVTCVVSNGGLSSYKKEEFGERITIVRTLTPTGSNIKIKSERGKVISTKMEDLRAMTLGLGIQVDNPISVLDQNTARHFLNQSKPTAKFELFMRATNLETLQQLYVTISLYVSMITQEIGRKERQLLENNADVQEAQRKFKLFENLEKDKAKGICLKMELLWAEARDFKMALDRAQQQLAKVQRDKERLAQMLSSDEQSEPLLQQIESADVDVRALDNQSRDLENEIKDLRLQFQAASQKQKKIQQEKQFILNRLKQDEKTIEEYKAEIRSQEERLMPGHVDMRRKQREEIQGLQSSLQQLRAERDTKAAEMNALQNKLNSLNETLDSTKRNKRNHEEEIRRLQSSLQGFEASESNLTLFGPNMPALVQCIETNQNQFRKKPVGPLGAYVRVKESMWTNAVECVIRGRLSTFVVDNADDERILQGMIKRVITRGQKPSIIRTPFPTKEFDTSRTAARTQEYKNVQDVIEVSDVVALNMLIDLCNIEKTLLIPTDNECHQLLAERHSVPENCGRAFTLSGDIYYPAPNYKTYGTSQRQARVLQTSRDEIIRDTRLRINEMQQTVQTETQNLSQIAKEVENANQQLRTCRSEIQAISKKYVQMQTELEQLKDVEQPDVNSVSVLRDELANKEKELEANKSQLDRFPEQIDVLEKEKEAIQEKGTDLKKKEKEINKQKDVLKSKQKSCREQLDEIKSAQVGKKRKLDQASKQEELFTKECEELSGKCEKCTAEAEKYDSYVQSEAQEKGQDFKSMSETTRQLKTIDQELRTLNKKLAVVEKTLGQNAESTEEEFRSKLQAYNATKKYIIHLKNNAESLKNALSARKSLYHTQKNLMCAVVSHQFTRVLRYRNCTGSVKVDFDTKELQITVGPIDEGERTGLGTSSLSGGERSYATMAFVIALWNVTELPFYFLDEFDVFMDRLNRQTVLTLLLRFAKQKKGYQFGFLTPQDTTVIKSSRRVSIFKLDPPRKE